MLIMRRAATEGDIPFLLSLRRQTMDAHLVAAGLDSSTDAHLARIAHEFTCAEVLLQGGHPIGLLKVMRSADAWELIQIQIVPEAQGRGVGRAVLDELIAAADAAGASLTLSVLRANPAQRLYRRLGFVVVAEDSQSFTMRRAAR